MSTAAAVIPAWILPWKGRAGTLRTKLIEPATSDSVEYQSVGSFITSCCSRMNECTSAGRRGSPETLVTLAILDEKRGKDKINSAKNRYLRAVLFFCEFEGSHVERVNVLQKVAVRLRLRIERCACVARVVGSHMRVDLEDRTCIP